MNQNEKRDLFWSEYIIKYQSDLLRKASFKRPEHLLEFPFVGLLQLKGFGYSCAFDVLSALYDYFELDKAEELDVIEKLTDYIDKDDEWELETFGEVKGSENINDLDMSDRVYNIFYFTGYDTEEKIARMTVKNILDIRGVGYGAISDIADEVVRLYYKIFVPPKCVFKTKYDLRRFKYRLFEFKRES